MCLPVFPAQDRYFRGPFPVEVYGVAERAFAQGFLDARIQGLEYDIVFLELDFSLCRADIHIHRVRVHFEVDKICRGDPLLKKIAVCVHHGLVQVRAAEIASVDEEILVSLVFPGGIGTSGISGDIDYGSLGEYVDHGVHDGAPQEVLYPELQRVGLFQDIDFTAV